MSSVPDGDPLSAPQGEDLVRLERLLGPGGPGSLRERLRRHFERGGGASRLRLGALDADDHARLAGLTGRSPHYAASMQIDLGAIDLAIARAGLATSLPAALERLDGPIIDRSADRRRREARWAAVCAPDPGGEPAVGLRELLADPGGQRLLRRLARQDAQKGAGLIRAATRVLGALPARGMPRSQLAAQCLGDAHALDDGAAVATLVLAAWRWSGQLEAGEPDPASERIDEPAPEANPTERPREIWASAGILVNELARPALVLNLLQIEGRAAEPGQPTYLSLRRLVREPLTADALRDQTVFVCENPNLLAIVADELGDRSAPIVCTDGMPAAAQRTLLHQLVALGARLRYHGDFDWPGITIANLMHRQFGAEPWRMAEDDYRDAVAAAAADGPRLTGTPVAACWSPGLEQAMQTMGVPVAEEAVAMRLLDDLVLRHIGIS